MPAKSPLLKSSIHFALAASISAFCAIAGTLVTATNAITNPILRMIKLHYSWPEEQNNASLYPSALFGDRLISRRRASAPPAAGLIMQLTVNDAHHLVVRIMSALGYDAE